MTENNELENIPENIEIPEPEIIPNPWDNAPSDVYFYEKIYDDGDRDFWMTSQEALEYGMIDEILTKRK